MFQNLMKIAAGLGVVACALMPATDASAQGKLKEVLNRGKLIVGTGRYKDLAENAAAAQPAPKAGLPEDIARAALYLASDDSAFVTGTHVVVDGGITIGGRHAWDAAAGSPFAAIMGVSPEDMANIVSAGPQPA